MAQDVMMYMEGLNEFTLISMNYIYIGILFDILPKQINFQPQTKVFFKVLTSRWNISSQEL